tara:strand:+ start:110115 stop:110273 length:159 start_codon:yes stop_codon:yes gene_type:complete
MPKKETREETMARLGVKKDLVLAGPPDSRRPVGGVLVPSGRSEFDTRITKRR